MAGKTALYTVRDADIWCEAGRANIGDTVELDASEARHFNAIGVLAPYIPEDEPQEEEIGGLDG
jgi:hypothetical protein